MLQNGSLTAPSPLASEFPVLEVIRAEYREMPCLRLTKPQIQRLWGLDPATCDRVVTVLEGQRFLKRANDRYVLAV
jgi:hypothetical protein